MKDWLSIQLSNLSLSEENRGYLLGRGAEPASIDEMHVVTWKPAPSPTPCGFFKKQFGPHGERIEDYLIFPLYSMRSKVIGFITRSPTTKYYSKYLAGLDYHWNPVFLGLQRALPKIWAGGDLWAVEGVFDMFALEHIIPPKDGIVACGRAMMTDNQINFLRRFGLYVNLVFDMDGPGRKGAFKVMQDLKLNGIRGRNFTYTGGKDPGEIWDHSGEWGLRSSFIF